MVIKLKNATSPEIIEIRILESNTAAMSEETIGMPVPENFHDYRDFYENLVDVIYNMLTSSEATITQFVACDYTGSSSPPIDHFWEKMPGLWRYKDLYLGNMNGYGGESLSAPSIPTGYYSLYGADPDTCWYVKFVPASNSRDVDVQLYDHDFVLQSSLSYTMDRDCTRIQPWSYGIPFIKDFEAFKNSATAAASNQQQGAMVVSQAYYTEVFDPDSAYLYKHVAYSYLVKANSDYYTWLWYLYTNGGGDAPEPDPPDDPYEDDYGPSGPGGGGGTRPPYDKGDDLPYPGNPPVSICDSGLITLYTPSVTQLNLLAGDIWSNNFVTSLVKDVYADPIDVIINVGIVPFNVVPAGTKKIKVGERELDITSNYPDSNYVDFDLGEITIAEAKGAYTDYAPYTKGDIYIPFVGMCPLDIDYCMGHELNLKYKVDLCTGEAVAYLLVDDSVYQQYACNVKIDVPLSGADYSAMWNTIISATAALATAGVGGMAGATAAGEAAQGGKAMQAGMKSASDIMTGMSTKPQIQKTNSMPNTGGMIGYPYAFVILQHPALAIPSGQDTLQGYPSYMSASLQSLRGYTRVSAINLGIPGATKRELAEIEDRLKSGVRIESGTAPTGSGVVLINNESAPNVIGKKATLVADLTGHFRDVVDIVNPTVRIERASALGFNYVYIADFGRYYFVDEVKAYRNNVLELTLTCDPLESFKAQILAHTAIIDKQEKQWNLYLNDDSIKMYQYPLTWCKKFPNQFWDDFEYVLITAGG